MADPAMTPPADPMAQDAGMEQEPEGGFTVCIHSDADGNLSVGLESEGQEGPDEYASFKPAADRKEALTMALELLKSGGQADDSAQGDTEFDSGYANRGGSSPMM